ncbi:MAG: GAF domain-containing protein [Mycetocola sp.]
MARTVSPGHGPGTRRRRLIEQSWSRMRHQGVRPDRRVPRADPQAADPDAPATRELLSLVPMMNTHLGALTEDEVLVFVLADETGRVVHRESAGTLTSKADQLGFGVGAAWGERQVGTNAIGTALVSRQAVHIHATEHFLSNQHDWSCAGVPIWDPRSAGLLGVVDVSVPAQQSHPATLSLASLLAHTAHLELRERHRRELEQLRHLAWTHPAARGGEWSVVDRHGWIADAADFGTQRRVRLPDGIEPGAVVIPGLGERVAERLGDGWVLRAGGSHPAAPPELALHLIRTDTGADAVLESVAARHTVQLSARQAQLLSMILSAPRGLSARALSEQLYGSATHTVTVRAEISRLRRQLGDIIVAAPYRLAAGIVAGTPLGPPGGGAPDRAVPRSGSGTSELSALGSTLGL